MVAARLSRTNKTGSAVPEAGSPVESPALNLFTMVNRAQGLRSSHTSTTRPGLKDLFSTSPEHAPPDAVAQPQ